MNIKQIKELAQIVRENGLSALEFSENETKIRIECEKKIEAAAAEPVPVPAAPVASPVETAPVDFNRAREIQSPMVGVFYASSAPDAEPYVSVGAKVKKGQVICIIEAMKLMNEVTAELDGEVVEICAENGQIVEYGQTLMRLV